MTRSKKWSRVLRIGPTTMVAVGLVGCSQVRDQRSIEPNEPLDRLVLEVSNGSVEVVQSDTVRVDLSIRAPDGAVQHLSAEQDGILTIASTCTTPVLCAIDAVAHVPADLAVRVDLGRGEIWATGIQNLDVALGEGLADMDVTGTLTAQIGQGHVRAVAATGQLVRIAVGNGDIDLKVPQSAWAVDINAADWSIDGVELDRHARGSLELVAPSGRVRVRGRPVAGNDSGSPATP